MNRTGLGWCVRGLCYPVRGILPGVASGLIMTSGLREGSGLASVARGGRGGLRIAQHGYRQESLNDHYLGHEECGNVFSELHSNVAGESKSTWVARMR